MPGCCDTSGYASTFGGRFPRAQQRRYRRRGIDRNARRMVDFLESRGLDGATVLEIGGGVGDVQLELLRRGAARATNLELVEEYDDVAAELAAEAGLADRIDRRIIDIAADPDAVDAADVVLLHRVVCCYPAHAHLLRAAADHAKRLLVFSYPPPHLVNRSIIAAENLRRRLSGNSFRAFAHPPQEMMRVLHDAGLRTTYQHRGPIWTVAGLERARPVPRRPG